jgi:hypothetical protein
VKVVKFLCLVSDIPAKMNLHLGRSVPDVRFELTWAKRQSARYLAGFFQQQPQPPKTKDE